MISVSKVCCLVMLMAVLLVACRKDGKRDVASEILIATASKEYGLNLPSVFGRCYYIDSKDRQVAIAMYMNQKQLDDWLASGFFSKPLNGNPDQIEEAELLVSQLSSFNVFNSGKFIFHKGMAIAAINQERRHLLVVKKNDQVDQLAIFLILWPDY